MKCKKNLIFIMILLFLSIINVTYAYFTESKTFENDFNVADFNVVIEENFEQGFVASYDDEYIPKEVFVVNKKNTPAIVRISYNEILEEYLYGEAGYGPSFLINVEFLSGIVEFDWTEEFDNYFVYQDGWFYYRKVLPANTSIKIMSGIILTDEVLSGSNYNLDFNIEAVQATPEAVEEVWGWEIEIDESGNIFYNFPDS